MSPPLLTAATSMTCPHGGTVTPVPGAARGIIDSPILRVSDTFTVVGCAFTLPGPPPVPSPCVTVQWSGPSPRVSHAGAPVLTAASVGQCLAATQAPQGPVIIAGGQPRVTGQ
jgi:hypothetical protein